MSGPASSGSQAALNAAFAAALVEGLVRGGVREVVLSPGARSAPLALALAARHDLRLHVVVDERAAAFLALGLARASGRAAAFVCTSGTAPAHALPAVIEAALSAVPLLVLSADRPEELQACGAPQTIEQQRLFGPHARWFAQLGPAREGAPREWPAAVAARAVDHALGPPAGPVQLNVAFREPLWQPGCEGALPPVGAPRLLRATPRLDPAQARAALSLLEGPGVIVAGPRAFPPGGEGAAAALALGRRLGWPLLADALSGLRHGPFAAEVVSAGDALLRDPGFARAHRPRAALRLGQLPTSKPLATWLEAAAPATALVDAHGQWHDPTHAAAALLVADAAQACAALLAAAEELERPTAPAEWGASWEAAERAARQALEAATREGWWEGALARALVEALPAGALLHAGSSLPVRDLDAFGGARPAPLALVGQRGANGIDGGVAAAAGAALGWTRGPAAALLGDVALVHDLGGLLAACELEAPLTLVVVDNGGGAIFSELPLAGADPERFRRLFLTPPRLDLARACAGLGAPVLEVGDLPGLRQALAEAPGRGPRVVLARVERSESARRREAARGSVSRAWRAARAPAEEVPCP